MYIIIIHAINRTCISRKRTEITVNSLLPIRELWIGMCSLRRYVMLQLLKPLNWNLEIFYSFDFIFQLLYYSIHCILIFYIYTYLLSTLSNSGPRWKSLFVSWAPWWNIVLIIIMKYSLYLSRTCIIVLYGWACTQYLDTVYKFCRQLDMVQITCDASTCISCY